MIRQLEVTVYGRVQGVSFRHYTKLEAQRLGLSGWVANQHDGTVRVLAQGPEAALDGLVTFLRRGPTWARVDRLEVQKVDVSEKLPGFGIRWL